MTPPSAAWHATKRGEGAGAGIEQHLVALARVGRQPEGPLRTQPQVHYLHAPVNAANDQPLVAPVELEGFAKFETQWHEGLVSRRSPRP